MMFDTTKGETNKGVIERKYSSIIATPKREIMKMISVLLLLPTSLLAFQLTAVPIRTQMAKVVVMNYLPDKFARAEYCATHNGACSLEELEELVEGK